MSEYAFAIPPYALTHNCRLRTSIARHRDCHGIASGWRMVLVRRVRDVLLAAIVVACVPEHAVACHPGFEETMFFEPEDLVGGLDAPIIVDVTIKEASREVDYRDAAVAHINRIIKGDVDGEKIRIILALSSCDRGFKVGMRGIVFGAISRSPAGEQELVPIYENMNVGYDRRRRFNSPSTR